MGWFSGPSQKGSQKHQIERQQQKDLRSNERNLDREIRNLTLQEQKLQAEIKVLAKKNQEEAARILAKQIIEIRQSKQKLMAMKGQISSVSMQSKQVKTQNIMAKSLSSSTSAMKLSNQQLNPQQTQAMMMAYEKESMKMEMGSEMINDTFESVFDSAEAGEEEDALVEQVYDEIGLEFSESVKATPSSKISAGKNKTKVSDDELNKYLAQFEQ